MKVLTFLALILSIIICITANKEVLNSFTEFNNLTQLKNQIKRKLEDQPMMSLTKRPKSLQKFKFSL